ncbi:hypothetical protein Celf_0177 [Cellulomonas fimi ATCC 484]|uniref:Uncharacterized protein n=2 Tax=Cellulomonas fimi TaxID=1708 RepID=F4H5J9_CELFA|nr:hypothetical protein Celf_0177 [Cellulomonas fimi ATCC 484]VEH26124.1 Uncharacterised protein [Cellulomonas fimi]
MEFGEMYVAARSNVITWDGLDVHATYEAPGSPTLITVEVQQFKAPGEVTQGLRLSVRDGEFVDPDGDRGTEVNLWIGD